MKKVKDGRHIVFGEEVYTEKGYVMSGRYRGRMTYPYRASKYGGWDLDTRMSINAFRKAASRGTAQMM